MQGMWKGPQPQNHLDRMKLMDRIVGDLHVTYGDDLQAIALYGSLARATDGDYSDIELWCVLKTPGIDQTLEWVYGPNKVEVDIYGEDVMATSAAEVDSMWSLSQGALINCRPLYGDRAYFLQLQEMVMAPPKKSFDDVIAEMVVGEFYEWMGKIRNGVGRNDLAFLTITTCNFTLHLALMAALLHRHIYSTSSALMKEALALPTLPDGYHELATMVMGGELHDKARVVAALEATWAGMGPWLAQHEISFDERNRWPWGNAPTGASGG